MDSNKILYLLIEGDADSRFRKVFIKPNLLEKSGTIISLVAIEKTF